MLETKGAIVQLTRKAVIDDDRQLLAGVPHELGREAARSIGDTVNTALDDVAGVFFTTARNNLMSGPSSALSVDALTLAIIAMRTQRDDSGRVVNMAPKYLLVGADLEATARSIINSTDLGVVDGSPRGNPMQKAAEVLVDARIAASVSRYEPDEQAQRAIEASGATDPAGSPAMRNLAGVKPENVS